MSKSLLFVQVMANDWARERSFGPNPENVNGLRSWFWARSAITYTSKLCHNPCTTGAEGLVMDPCLDSVTVPMALSKHTDNSPHTQSQIGK